MNEDSHNQTTLQRLLAELTASGLSEQQFRALDELLTKDPSAREEYRRYLELHAMLQFEYTPQPSARAAESSAECPTSVPSVVAGQRPPSGRRPAAPGSQATSLRRFLDGILPTRDGNFSLPKLSALVVAAMLVGSGLTLWMTGWNNEKSPGGGAVAQGGNGQVFPLDQPAINTPVAYLTSANGCNWGSQSQSLWQVGRSVQSSDELTLYEGMAEFRLASGVMLSIEGPAALVLNSPTSLVVQHGKVTAHVPWGTSDFKVLAGACRLTARDAEFGVHVTGNKVETHVFSGSVVAAPSFMFANEQDDPWEDGATVRVSEFGRTVIESGRALTLTNEAGGIVPKPSWHVAEEAEFATRLTMAGPLPISQKYVAAVLESRPAAYWRFESTAGGVIVNEISGGVNLDIQGDLHLVRNNGNHVAEFGRPGSEGFLLSPASFDVLSGNGYSVEFWIKPSHVHRAGIVSLLKNPYTVYEAGEVDEEIGQRAFYVQLLGSADWPAPGLFRVLHRDPPSEIWENGVQYYSKRTYSLRRWQHVAVVKENSHQRFYVNGRLVETQFFVDWKLVESAVEPVDFLLAKGLRLVVGQGRHPPVLGQFIGQLDELAIYDRALNEQEIRQRWKLIEWSQTSVGRGSRSSLMPRRAALKQSTQTENDGAKLAI